MAEVISAIADFIAQPFGAFGAVCIMLAVTVINSRWLRERLGLSDVRVGDVFNGLNLVGGACLFANAIVRSEIVWIVLETYFVLIATKGIVQSRRQLMAVDSSERDVAALQEPEQTRQLVLQGFDT